MATELLSILILFYSYSSTFFDVISFLQFPCTSVGGNTCAEFHISYCFVLHGTYLHFLLTSDRLTSHPTFCVTSTAGVLQEARGAAGAVASALRYWTQGRSMPRSSTGECGSCVLRPTCYLWTLLPTLLKRLATKPSSYPVQGRSPPYSAAF